MLNESILIAHMEDMAERARQSGCAASRFINPAQSAALSVRMSGRRDIRLCLDGGYGGAERVRAIFLQPEWGAYARDDLFTALRLNWRKEDVVGHRDILGALMSLGLERDILGDIWADANSATLICLPELAAYISENLQKAGRVGLSISTLALDEIAERTENLLIKTDTVASLRLDALLCVAFNLSRGRAGELISAGLVSLDHQPCLRPDKEISPGSLLSARGMGRARLLEAGGVSRKGRIRVSLGLYGQKTEVKR